MRQTPYTFLSEDAELRVEPDYFAEHWRSPRAQAASDPGGDGPESERLLTVHGHAVFSADRPARLRRAVPAPARLGLPDALAIAPYEPTWYTMWLQHDQTIPIVMREPVIKTFHNPTQYLDYVLRGLGPDDVARGYVGIVLNSNYSRGDGLLSLDPSRPTAAGVATCTGPTSPGPWAFRI